MAQPTKHHDNRKPEFYTGDQGKGGGLQTQDTDQGSKNLPAIQDFGEDAGMGMENVDKSEYRIPFIVVLQSNSPQCDAEAGGDPKLVGTFYNTSTGELYDGNTGLDFVPCHRDHNFVEFIPRTLGGGFVAFHKPDDRYVLDLIEKQGRFGRLSTATKFNQKNEPLDGTELQETMYLAGLMSEPGKEQWEMVIFPFKSTQIKKYQGFVGRYMKFTYPKPTGGTQTPPIFAHKWKMTTTPESNKKGKFRGVLVRLWAQEEDGREKDKQASLIDMREPLYQKAREFALSFKSGKSKLDGDQAAGAARQREPGEEDDVEM